MLCYYYFRPFFPDKPGSAGFSSDPSLPPVPEENLCGIIGTVLPAGRHSYHPSITVKALREHKRTNPNQWSGLVLSYFIYLCIN